MADDAWLLMERALQEAGLDSLLPQVKQWVYSGVGAAELELRVRETDAYKERTKVNEVRRANGKNPLTLGEIVATERAIAQVMHQAGLPAGFYDEPDDFMEFIGRDISAAEVQHRVAMASEAAYNMDPEVRRSLTEMYGLSQGDLTAYYLDPDRSAPILERQQQSARVRAEARRRSLGLSTEMAEDLVQRGVTTEQAAAGFDQVARLRGLTPGRADRAGLTAGETINEASLVDAAFGDTDAQRRTQRVLGSRMAQFEGGGGLATTERGVSGVGGNRR